MKNKETNLRERILVVDDDPAVGSLLGEALSKEGYEPVTCVHPADAISAASRESFDLAFVDIHLPGMSGLDLAFRLKKQDPRMEVVFITGQGSLQIAVQAIKLGAYDYLGKPFSLNEFRLCLKRFQERRILKEKARLAEQRYYQLVQNIPLLIYVLNPDFRLDFVNEACSTILGYTIEEALTSPRWILDVVHAKSRVKVKEAFQRAFTQGEPVSMECQFIHRDGRKIHTILKSIPGDPPMRPEEGGRLEGFIVDISDRVFLEKALIQKEKIKTLGAISAEVAHEIRNPLVCIGGFARRLQKRHPDLAECNIILKESERLEKILSRIRNYLRPVEIYPRQCSASTILAECLDLLSPEIEARQVECVVDLDSELPPINADPDVLAQIFINLIRNGMENLQKGGALTLRTFQSERELHVSFRNDFSGPAVQNPDSFFMPFAEGGRGIGLPLCYRLTKDMGGVLSFSQDLDSLVFTVSLPKSEPGTPFRREDAAVPGTTGVSP
ncbi:MAG: response regulator [Deltaproteobacteria bacterium]|nr:response regulator [Deltaproteobacteria bacterium]